MRRGYVDTRHGQVHVRTAGAADAPALLLVHWTPFSGRMWEGVAPLLAAAGRRVIAPDLLGYGRSDPRLEAWSVGAWAANLLEVADALGAGELDVVGGHNGASVAAEMGIAAPGRVRRLVIDGAPLLTPELRAAFAGLSASPPPASPDIPVERTLALLREYVPGYRAEGEGLAMVWPALIDYLETRFVSSGPVAAAYDLAERLPLVPQPALLLGAERDALAANFEAAAKLLQPVATHWFPGDHPIHFAGRQAEWAGLVLAFLSSAHRGEDSAA